MVADTFCDQSVLAAQETDTVMGFVQQAQQLKPGSLDQYTFDTSYFTPDTAAISTNSQCIASLPSHTSAKAAMRAAAVAAASAVAAAGGPTISGLLLH